MKKRIFGVLIAMCILIGVAPFRVAAVEEQFSLQVGETYYFDLTGECKNDGMIPYSGYIPFTYVGTIDAYVIKGTQSSHNSQTYLHSLFVAEEGLGARKGWDLTNSAGLIYGKDYVANGITYTLRSLSGGDTKATDDRSKGSPANNEWDVIVGKDSSLIKKKGDFYSCVQEYRIVRGGQYGFENRTNGGWAAYDVFLRLALELPQNLANDAMKPVTLYLNGMRIGSDENASSPEKIKIVVKAGESYLAPTAAGLTPPSIGIVGSELLWMDNDGNFYEPGESVPATVDELTASWFRPEPGPQGEKGEDGEDGVTPQLKVGDDNLWYVSYDEGSTWLSLGVSATGATGQDGKTPRLKIGDDNLWCVSYDGGQTWNSLEVKATGADGKDGTDGRDGADGQNGQDGKDGTDGQNGLDGAGVASVTVNPDGSIIVRLTDGRCIVTKDGGTPQAGNVSVTKEEIQKLKTTIGIVAGVAGVSLAGILFGIAYALLKRKKLS